MLNKFVRDIPLTNTVEKDPARVDIKSCSLYLILLFGSPFSGDLKVSPEPFRTMTRVGSYYKEKVTTTSAGPINHSSESLIPQKKYNDKERSKPKTARSR